MWSGHGITEIPREPPMQSRSRRYAHRVKESLSTLISKLVCAIFLFLLLILGIIAFILWLSLRPHRPRFHVRSFSFPALAQENGLQTAAISFNVTDRNPNQNVGLYYDAVSASVYYREKVIGATPLLFPFYQPPKNTTWAAAVLSGATLTVGEEVWKQMLEDRVGGAVGFRLELVSTVHFKVSSWGSKRHRMHSSCDVLVGPDGEILQRSKDKRCSIYFD